MNWRDAKGGEKVLAGVWRERKRRNRCGGEVKCAEEVEDSQGSEDHGEEKGRKVMEKQFWKERLVESFGVEWKKRRPER